MVRYNPIGTEYDRAKVPPYNGNDPRPPLVTKQSIKHGNARGTSEVRRGTSSIHFHLGCRKWGCNKWGFKGCLAALPGNRPKSAFFTLFLPFSPFGPNSTWEIQKTEAKAFFLRYPLICLNLHLLNPHLRHSNPLSGTPVVQSCWA